MISIKTKETKPARAPGFEGVTYTIRSLTKIQRSIRDFSCLEHRLRYQIIFEELRENVPENFDEWQQAIARGIELVVAGAPAEQIEAAKAEASRLGALVNDTPEMRQKRGFLDYEAGLVMNIHIKPAALKAGLVDIKGLEIDGVPATVSSLIESGTPELNPLIDEIYHACEAAAGLTGTQQKNSPSPTTSSAPVVGETNNSSAAAAS